MKSKKVIQYLRSSALIIMGAYIMSIAVNGLFLPNDMLSGGVTGIAIYLNITFGFNISMVIVAINIPIFVLGYLYINRTFVVQSLIGMTALSVFIELNQWVDFSSHEVLTTVLLGGVISGVGMGLILRANGSTGGNDIISKILNRYFSYSISTLNFAFNVIIVALSINAFGIDKAIQTLAAMYVAAYTARFMLEGVNYKRTLLIITDKPRDVAMAINRELRRGCTLIEGEGSYTANKRTVLYAVISINQVAKLRMILREIDNDAFVNVMETKVVFGSGRGFLKIQDLD